MYQFKKSFWGTILLVAAVQLCICPLASAQGNLNLSLSSFPPAAPLNPDSIPFGPGVNYATGGDPLSVFCADLDGDSDLDLAVAEHMGGYVSIFKNNGDGTFQPGVRYPAGMGTRSVFCADLDGDSDLDLAVVYDGGDNVSILENKGDGTFETKVDYAAGSDPWSVFCADLDGDSDLDLAVGNAYSDEVSILKNKGDGTFQTAPWP